MRNAMLRELMALLGIDKTFGLPYQPTYQAPTERSHHETKVTLTCILEDLIKSKPTLGNAPPRSRVLNLHHTYGQFRHLPA